MTDAAILNTVSKAQKKSRARQKVRSKTKSRGLRFERMWTVEGKHPFDMFEWTFRDSTISNPDGSLVFSMKDVEIPIHWSQLATDIVVSKYFRKAGVPKDGCEKSVKQLVTRLAQTLHDEGLGRGGYFATEKDAQIFKEELTYMLTAQVGAFNSPVWFNLGLYHQYGINGSAGNWAWDFEKNDVVEIQHAYEHPQCSACFIQRVEDNLMDIFQLVKNEARLFKYGSGTGTNFSRLRAHQEKLSGGGTSSGLMSFLEVFDRAAGATKSGGTTRRAAKMVCLDMDHPEIVDFIQWKEKEELKVKALIDAGYESDFNGDAYRTVSGQNSNNSVRITDEFMDAVLNGGKWSTKKRTTGEICQTYEASELFNKISKAAWSCADPGLQFDTTINDWHTCADTDRIYASNPCSEYMFLDNTACNLASINLMKCLNNDNTFNVPAFRHACRTFFAAQEILVDLSSYPTQDIARNSHNYRPLGLGYANLGSVLMSQGLPYDSDKARQTAAAITAIMTGTGYSTSAEMAASKRAFPAYEKNQRSMLRVMRKHRDAAYELDDKVCPAPLRLAAQEDWDNAVLLGEWYGYRNAQATVLAPTGTIGLLMDCDTTGIEPDYALVKFKKLAGGGYFKIVNETVPRALKALNYSQDQIGEILHYVQGSGSLEQAPHINRKSLDEKGFLPSEIEKIEALLPSAFDISFAFSPALFGDEALERLGINKESTNILKELDFATEEIAQANQHICGTMTLEGAPYLKEEHLSIFDCANRCGTEGKRFIAPMGHVRMMATTQPFLSGAISKTVNLPSESTVEEIRDIYINGWKLGLKAIALYRDGCKSSQPLSAKTTSATEEQKETRKQPLIPKVPLTRRVRLPRKRRGFTQEARVGGHKVYLRTGEYVDGSLGEIFIDMHKEGASFRSMMNCFAIAVSIGMQHGVPLDEYVDCFTFTRFEPQGPVDHPNIKMATSVIDYIFRVLGMEYLGRTDFLQVKENASTPAARRKTVEQILNDTLGPDEDKLIEKRTAFLNDTYLTKMMGDAPFCDNCGHTTVRNGTCYKCINCGNSMGCS